MSKKIEKSFLAQLKAELLQLKDLRTDDGKELTVDGELEVGKDILINVDGEYQPAPTGEYSTGEVVIVVESGKVTEIREARKEEPKPEPQNMKSEKYKAISQMFSETYDAKMGKIVAAITAMGFMNGWLVSASDTEAVWEVYEPDGNYKYMRFDVSWNGEEAIVSNPIEVEQAFVPKGQTIDFSAMDTMKAENEKLKAHVSELEQQIKMQAVLPSIEESISKQEPEKPLAKRLADNAHKRQ